MKKMKQFEDATLELVLFGFDVLTASDGSALAEEDDPVNNPETPDTTELWN